MIDDGTNPAVHAERQLTVLYAPEGGLDAAVAWARAVLAADDRYAAKQPLRSARFLRRTDRRLSRVSARYLVNAVSGRDHRGRGPRSPLLR